MIPKFRAWDRYEEAMTDQHGIYFGAMDHDETLGSLMNCLEERYELIQSAGVRDKNAKCEIHRKDILLVETLTEVSFKAKVVYEQGSFGIVALEGDMVDYFPKHWNDTFMPLSELYWIFDCEDNVLDNVEILGNELENPELLEAT